MTHSETMEKLANLDKQLVELKVQSERTRANIRRLEGMVAGLDVAMKILTETPNVEIHTPDLDMNWPEVREGVTA